MTQAFDRRWILACAASWLATACAVTPPVEIDRIGDVELTRQRSYAIDAERLGAGEPAWGPTAREAARETLDAALRARGLEPAESIDSADLVFAVGIRTETRAETGSEVWLEDDVRVARRRTGLRTPVGDVPLAEERRVVRRPRATGAIDTRDARSRSVLVEITEAESGRLVWQGKARNARARERVDIEDLKRSVAAIAARLP